MVRDRTDQRSGLTPPEAATGACPNARRVPVPRPLWTAGRTGILKATQTRSLTTVLQFYTYEMARTEMALREREVGRIRLVRALRTERRAA